MLGQRFHLHQRSSLALALLCTVSCAMAQAPVSQEFVVEVPAKSSVVAPAAVAIVHDQTELPQVFPAQFWSLSGNSPLGMVVDFAVNQAFTHRLNGSSKGDAELRVRVHETSGPASWTATKAIDATSFANSDEHAVVQVMSDAAGSARIDLGVRFLTSAELATGEYVTTVFCTITTR